MGFHVYPVTPELSYNGYIVKLNGTEVPLNTARVSAVPFNRRWPGHQRQIEQSEFINFVSFEMDGPVELEIFPKNEFQSIVIRPMTADVSYKIVDGRVRIKLKNPQYITVEPYGRSNALHIFADPYLNLNISKDDPNIIYFGTGSHEVGLLHLKSNQTVVIDEGAVVYGCIHAIDAKNIKIIGHGILDNSHNKEKILFELNAENNDKDVGNAQRLHTIQLEYCTDIQIIGITIRDSLVYNIRPIACKNLEIRNVKIIGCWRYNSDGIDSHNCQNVRISDCFIRSFDDSICVKGFDYTQDETDFYRGQECFDSFKDFLVERCVIWNDWGKCLEIGAETRAKEISHIVFKDCHIIHVTGSVLDSMNVDYADIHDIIYENITVEYDDVIPEMMFQQNDAQTYADFKTDQDYAPCLISSSIMYHPEYSAGGVIRGKNRTIRFSNIRLYGRQMPKIEFVGYDDAHKISDVTITQLYWNDKQITAFQEIKFACNQFCERIELQ